VTCFPFVHSPVETAKPQEHPLETFHDGPPDSSSLCSQPDLTGNSNWNTPFPTYTNSVLKILLKASLSLEHLQGYRKRWMGF